MQKHKDFWDKNAGRYDRFIRKDRAAYDEMYELIRPVVRHLMGIPENYKVLFLQGGDSLLFATTFIKIGRAHV